MLILGIESSCDETAAAVVLDGIHIVSSVVSSSSNLHEITGGVVPEVAARKQVEYIVPVIESAILSAAEKLSLNKSQLISQIDSIAVTAGPGLMGSLSVGVNAAKALSLAWNKPLIPVNHLIGHIYANFLDTSSVIVFPALVLVVSGGHTDLVLMKNHGEFEYLGGTLDDAAGEAFDKTARLLGIKAYLGGPALSALAASIDTAPRILPRPKIHDLDYDFSFSGLKTAVWRLFMKKETSVEHIAHDFENAVVEVLVKKTIRAVSEFKVKDLLLGGGVAANRHLRAALMEALPNTTVHIPPVALCGDNAAYIASAAYFNRIPKILSEVVPNPSLTIQDHTF